MTYIKGGLLSTTQLESISGKKWKKGGILSATQLNELSGGEGNVLIKSIPIKVINNSGGVVQIHYVNITDGKMSYKQLYQTADDAEEIIDCCIFDAGHGMSAIPFTGSFANKGINKISITSKSGTSVYIQGPVTNSVKYGEYITYYGVSFPDDEMLTITVEA